MSKAKAVYTFEDNREATIKFKKKGKIEEFSQVGRLNTLHAKIKNPQNIDIVDLMDTLPPTANNLLKMLKDQLDYRTNESALPKPNNTTEQKRRSNATRILKQHEAIKKTGQRSFIINPYLILPPPDYQERILAKWNSIQ